MELIEEDIRGAEGQGLFVCLREVLSVWVDQYLDREQSKVKLVERTWEKIYGEECRLVKDLRAGRVWGAARRAAFYSACERLNKIRQKNKPPEPLKPFQEPKQHPRFARQTSLLRIDFQQTALFDAE